MTNSSIPSMALSALLLSSLTPLSGCGQKEEAHPPKAVYEQSVLTAFQEVSNALITRQKLAEVRVFDQQAVVALTSSVDLATQRYLNGKSGYFEVLPAQQEFYPTQRAQVQAQVGELIAVVQLYKALGGGWQTSPQVDNDQKTADAPQITPDKPAPTSASDGIEVVMEGDTSVVNVYHERGIGGAEVRMPKSGWPAVVVVRLHGFRDLESFKADAGASSLNCELQRPEGRTPEQICRMGNTRLEALRRTPQFYQVTLPKSMLTPQVRTAELHWVDQWR